MRKKKYKIPKKYKRNILARFNPNNFKLKSDKYVNITLCKLCNDSFNCSNCPFWKLNKIYCEDALSKLLEGDQESALYMAKSWIYYLKSEKEEAKVLLEKITKAIKEKVEWV